MTDEQELLDYDEADDAPQTSGVKGGSTGVQNGGSKAGGPTRGSYVSIHASGFKDFLLKPELLRAIMDCGFEHPSAGSNRRIHMMNLDEFVFQYNMNRFHRLFLVQILYVKPNRVWVKRLFLFLQHFNNLNLSMDK